MNRKVLILANVGNRDVKCGGRFVSPAREKGAELYGKYAQVSADIELPILFPALRYVESLGYKYREIYNQDDLTLRLFYTDQEDTEHRAEDTLELAKIAKEKILESFSPKGKKEGLRIRGSKAIVLSPVRSNPSRYDHMHSFYEDVFDRNPRLQDPEEYLCFVLLSGGTPQMNAMLLLHSVRHFGSNCVQVYVSPNKEVRSLRVGTQIAQMDARRRFNEALEVHQFRAAARIAEVAFEGGSGRAAACRYAEHRMVFDFKRAREYCEKSLRVAERSLEGYLEEQRDEIDRLEADATPGRDKKRLLAELFYNIEVKYAAGEFVDVLGRVFRLQEEILTRVVGEHTDLQTGKKLDDQKKALEALPGLLEFLENDYRTANGENLDPGREVNRVGLAAIVEYLAEKDSGLSEDEKARISRMAQVSKKIEKLASLRNKTILAHGFEGVSEEEIVDAYGSKTLVENLRVGLGEVLEEELLPNPFFELSKKLKF